MASPRCRRLALPFLFLTCLPTAVPTSPRNGRGTAIGAIAHPSSPNYLAEVKTTMDIARFASLATFSKSSPDINSRVIFPKPTNVTDAPQLEKVYFATNKYSRKFAEISPSTRVNILYWDSEGVGYVTLRGEASICDADEAQAGWWSGWDHVYPEGPSTEFYTLIRVVPDWIEFASYDRFHVDEGRNRTDWRPLTLVRESPDKDWKILPGN
mmetsp:Transcript_29270/g.71372  ORF Transcript_29270/g.71372 Transcript_29270/m.71372 type:complete len:211 (-) Transcript_29270:126-758(-)